MNSSNEQVIKQLTDLIKQGYTVEQLLREAKLKIAAEEAAKTTLVATYRISGVPYTVEVPFTDTASHYCTAQLLNKVIDSIKKNEKTSMGVLNLQLSVSIKKGDRTIPVRSFSVEREWLIKEDDFKETVTELNAARRNIQEGR